MKAFMESMKSMALSIVNVYGSIGFTNYGYIDKSEAWNLEEA